MEVFRDLFFPKVCILCEFPGEALCRGCESYVAPFIASPLRGVTQCVAASKYSERMREVVVSYKSGRRAFGAGLAQAMLKCIYEFQIEVNAVVAVPSPEAKIRQRGFDTVGILASHVAKQMDVPNLRALSLTKHLRDQVGLSPHERRQNLAGAFQSIRLIPKRVLLLDDVVTTGATVEAAAESLRIAGAQEIFVVCACRTVGRFTV